MKINALFDKRVVVHSQNLTWQDSPMAGVSRRPLDRVGNEVARATTIVKYAENSHFSAHIHTGGEEFIVLSGVFQDEHGDFPAGSYIRNPPQSKHRPSSTAGCVIFVKLWQFQPQDRIHVRLNINVMQAVPHRDYLGIAVTPLYSDEHEDVSILAFEPHAKIQLNVQGGAEMLVLEGALLEGADKLQLHSWLRAPIGANICAKAGKEGAKVWLKQRHLLNVDTEIKRVLNA